MFFKAFVFFWNIRKSQQIQFENLYKISKEQQQQQEQPLHNLKENGRKIIFAKLLLKMI